MAGSTEVKLHHILSICTTLEKLLLPSFGPNGLNTMLSTSSGQLMVVNDSWSILNSVHLLHPCGKMIINSIKNHVKSFGDGGKTFVLLTTHIFKEIELKGGIQTHKNGRQALVRGLNKLKGEIPHLVEGLLALSLSFDLLHATGTAVKEEFQVLINTQLSSSFPLVIAQHLSDILISFLFDGLTTNVCNIPDIILDAITNYDTCYVEAVGHHPSSSQVIEGFVIQRDFFTLVPSLSSATNIKFVLFNCSLDGEASDSPAIFSVDNEQGLQKALQHKNKIMNGIIERLKKDCVTLVISCVKINSAESLACHAAGISTVHMVDDEEITRLSLLFGIQPVNYLHEYMTEPLKPIGEVFKCGYVILGRHRYVHLIPENAYIYGTIQQHTAIMKQILITGHSKGVCCQVRTVLKNCLKCLHLWLTTDATCVINNTELVNQCPVSIPSGGTFELYMYMQLKNKAVSCQDPDYARICSMVAAALLQVPVKLLKNSYHPKAQTMNAYHILEKLNDQCPGEFMLNARSGEVVRTTKSNYRDPMFSKISMLYNVLDLVIQLLLIDKLVPVTAIPDEENE